VTSVIRTREDSGSGQSRRNEIVYLRLESPRLALQRIAARVRQGGHAVPARDVLRRFGRSWKNFSQTYRPLADSYVVYDNSGSAPIRIRALDKKSKEFDRASAAGRALRRAARVARKTARMHGTPIYVLRDGKVVAEKP
jgi:predicted ABC-type ATPase